MKANLMTMYVYNSHSQRSKSNRYMNFSLPMQAKKAMMITPMIYLMGMKEMHIRLFNPNSINQTLHR